MSTSKKSSVEKQAFSNVTDELKKGNDMLAGSSDASPKKCLLSGTIAAIVVVALAAVVYQYAISPHADKPKSCIFEKGGKGSMPETSKWALSILSYAVLIIGIIVFAIIPSGTTKGGFIRGAGFALILCVFTAAMYAVIANESSFVTSAHSITAIAWWTLAVGGAAALGSYASRNWIIIK